MRESTERLARKFSRGGQGKESITLTRGAETEVGPGWGEKGRTPLTVSLEDA